MQFERRSDRLYAILTNPRDCTPVRISLDSLNGLPSDFLQRMLQATQSHALGCKFATQENYVYSVLRPFGEFLIATKREVLPANIFAWQHLISEFALWHLTNLTSKAKLESRANVWQKAIRPWLNFLVQDGVLPYGLIIFNHKLPNEVSPGATAFDSNYLGQKPSEKVGPDDPMERPPMDKTLAGPIFWRASEDYLLEVENLLRGRDKVLTLVLDDHWLKLVKDFRLGRLSAGKIPHQLYLRRAKSNNWKTKHPEPERRDLYVTSYNAPLALNWTLKILREELVSTTEKNCLTHEKIKNHVAFADQFSSTNTLTLIGKNTSLSQEQLSHYSIMELIQRFLGVLNGMDMAVGIAILIQEHPNFTPEAIASAEILDKNGKSYLLLTDSGDQMMFSIDKPRARERKYAVLTKRSRRVIKHLLRTTKLIRELLKRINEPQHRYLFLGVASDGSNRKILGHPTNILCSRLYKTYGLNLPVLYPILCTTGLADTRITFKKIRGTRGVIEWLKSGSVEATALILGNKPETTLEHYIPRVLLNLWNERLIRRFQNTLIILSMEESSEMLDAVDMPNTSELNNFLAQLMHDLPSQKSVISDCLREKFGNRFSIDAGSHGGVEFNFDQLAVKLSPESFAFLLAYRRWALEYLSTEEQNIVDKDTGLTPRHFIDLGEYLQAAVQAVDVSEIVRESLDIGKLKNIYSKSVVLIDGIFKKITSKYRSVKPGGCHGC